MHRFPSLIATERFTLLQLAQLRLMEFELLPIDAFVSESHFTSKNSHLPTALELSLLRNKFEFFFSYQKSCLIISSPSASFHIITVIKWAYRLGIRVGPFCLWAAYKHMRTFTSKVRCCKSFRASESRPIAVESVTIKTDDGGDPHTSLYLAFSILEKSPVLQLEAARILYSFVLLCGVWREQHLRQLKAYIHSLEGTPFLLIVFGRLSRRAVGLKCPLGNKRQPCDDI